MTIGAIGGLNASRMPTGPMSGTAIGTGRFDQVLAAASDTGGERVTGPSMQEVLDRAEPGLQHLTQADKAAIKSLFGVDIHDAEGVGVSRIAVPMDMDYDTARAVIAAAGRLGSERASGVATDQTITLAYMQNLVQSFRDRLGNDLPFFPEDVANPRLDMTA